VGSAPVAISTGPEKRDVFYYDPNKPSMLWRLHFDGTDNTFDVFQNFLGGQIAVRSQR
jgi:hypothetical protein